MKDTEKLIYHANLYPSESTEQPVRQLIYILQTPSILVMLILQTLIFLLHSSMTFLTTFFLISISLSQSQNKDTTTKSLWHWIKILCHYISNEIQMYEIGSNHWIPSNYNPCYLSSIAHSHDLQRCTITTYISCCTYLSESRKGQTSGTGGVEGRSFASAMMCSKVMSV